MPRSAGRREVYEMRWEVVRNHLTVNQPHDYWCTWVVPEKVKDIIEAYELQIEEFIIGGNGPTPMAPAGKRTGVLRCTLEGCNCGTTKHRTALNQTHTDRESVKRFARKHRMKGDSVAKSWNAPEAVANAKNDKDDLRIAQIRLLSAKGLPLTLFQSSEFKHLMRVVCRDHVYADQKVKTICVTAKTITTFCDKQAEINITDLKKVLPALVRAGSVNAQLDHKFVKDDLRGRTKILGISLSISNFQLERQSIMIEHCPMVSTGREENLPVVERVLEEYEILEDCRLGRIAIVTDQAANALASMISPSTAICSSHSLSCSLKRSIEVTLYGNAKSKWDDIIALICAFYDRVEVSSLPFKEAAPSLNVYCCNAPVMNAAHIRSWRLSEEKAVWAVVDRSEEEIDGEIQLKEANQITPFVGKALEKNLKRTTRFRKFSKAARNLLVNQSVVQPLFDDKRHPHAFLTTGIRPIDFDFLREIEPVLTRFEKGINRFESDRFQYGSAFFDEMSCLLIFVVKRLDTVRSSAEAYLRSVLQCLVEQLTCIKVDHNGIITKPTPVEGKVPQRLVDKDIACAFLDYDHTYCDFRKVLTAIGDSPDRQLTSIKKVLKEECGAWRAKAEDFILDLGRKWGLEDPVAPRETNPSQENMGIGKLNIDERQKKLGGLKQLRQARSLQQEISLYKEVNDEDIIAHRLSMKQRDVPSHLRVLDFWRRNSDFFPLLSQLAIVLSSSGNSSSSQERDFSWTSLQTSPHRRSLKPRTLLRLYQSAFDLSKIAVQNNNIVQID